MERGRFLVLEGIDGCGKTTQRQALADWLPGSGLMPQGASLHLTREPGGSALGVALRELLLHPPGDLAPCAEAELLLYAADRAQHVRQCIEPALAAGDWVLSDRFSGSTPRLSGLRPWSPAGDDPDAGAHRHRWPGARFHALAGSAPGGVAAAAGASAGRPDRGRRGGVSRPGAGRLCTAGLGAPLVPDRGRRSRRRRGRLLPGGSAGAIRGPWLSSSPICWARRGPLPCWRRRCTGSAWRRPTSSPGRMGSGGGWRPCAFSRGCWPVPADRRCCGAGWSRAITPICSGWSPPTCTRGSSTPPPRPGTRACAAGRCRSCGWSRCGR